MKRTILKELGNTMKVLIVCSGNSGEIPYSLENHKPFIYEQCQSLIKRGVEVDVFLIKGRGFIGYLQNLSKLRKKLKRKKYDLVHAHFGSSGMLGVMQRLCPVVVTFQGCDINRKDLRMISQIAMKRAKHNIFVSSILADKAKVKSKYSIVPYGVDLKETFIPLDKHECRKVLKLGTNERIALFSSSFDRVEKNYPLAKESVELVGGVRLIELGKGYSKNEINKLYNACDLLLMTSIREGSPQVIKEALACNCPIVSTDVGDVKELIKDIEGCYISSYAPEDVAEKIKMALDFGKRTRGRNRIISLGLDSDSISKKIIKLYEEVIR